MNYGRKLSLIFAERFYEHSSIKTNFTVASATLEGVIPSTVGCLDHRGHVGRYPDRNLDPRPAVNAPTPEFIRHATEGTLVFSFAAPILVALGCCGMMFGHERETSTWTWNSSLPISWQASLVSKLFVTVLCAIAALIVLSIVPALGAFATGGLDPMNQRLAIGGGIVTLMSTIDVIIFFSIAALLVRDTLHAMVLAAAWVIVAQSFLIFVTSNVFSANAQGASTEQAVAAGSFMLLGILGLVLLYRWRWGSGNNAELIVVPKSLNWGPTRQPNLAFTQSVDERGGLFATGWMNNLGARILITGLFLFLSSMASINTNGGLYIVSILGFLLLGTSAFSGDQTRKRYQFLADRGASPNLVTLSRVLPALSFALLIGGWALFLAFSTALVVNSGTLVVAVVATIFFALGALGSLCFRQPITAITVNALAVIAAISASNLVLNSGRLLGLGATQVELLPALVVLATITSLPILVYAIFSTTRRWLTLDRGNLGWHYVGFVAIALLLPATLTMCLLAAKHFGWY